MSNSVDIPRDQLASSLNEGQSLSHMAVFFGCSQNTVKRNLDKHGLRAAFEASKEKRGCARAGVKAVIDKAALARCIAEDRTMAYMAGFFGCSEGPVKRSIDEYGLRAAFDASKERRGCGGRPGVDGAQPIAPPRCADTRSTVMRAAREPAGVWGCSGPLAAPFWTPERDADIITTQGKYSQIAKLAEKIGVPERRIVGRWHQLRAMA